MIERARYDVYLNSAATGVCKAAECVLEENDGRLIRFAFRYDPSWLARPASFSLDPAQLPLGNAEITLDCPRGMPALVDDYLPDAWGRKVLTRFALAKNKKRLNTNSAIAMLELMGASRIGCLQITGKVFGLSKTAVARCAEQVAAAIDLWPAIAANAGVCERELEMLGRRMNK